ncbi:hypothetical protein GN138_13305 [Winogradskyella sp. HL2-2]|uniref:Uncharacterized protein n=2 Tax=Winogradskyella endarachnes TaxID=2681965 RepID=A0A6L6UF02_9FLAO|nr:hypothetical protein [Winogradskyella endarachnes]
MVLMALISAPTIIWSIDDSVDVTCFYSITEEEESHAEKLIFEHINHDTASVFEDRSNTEVIGYTCKSYSKPHLNLIFPPPDFI